MVSIRLGVVAWATSCQGMTFRAYGFQHLGSSFRRIPEQIRQCAGFRVWGLGFRAWGRFGPFFCQ